MIIIKISNLKFPACADRQISKGFTLIELLIVIALLGALAVGLLATVDPFEQLKKGTDTSRRNTTSEIYNSMIRYYSVKSAMPFTADVNAMQASHADMTSGANGYINMVISAGELKPEFIELAGSGNLSKVFITSTTIGSVVRQNVALCFKPESKSFSNDPNSQYGPDGIVSSNCLSNTPGGTACYWCIK